MSDPLLLKMRIAKPRIDRPHAMAETKVTVPHITRPHTSTTTQIRSGGGACSG